MQPTMPITHSGGDPRHTFLKPQEVIARYRWGRTRGYLELKKAGFPRPIGGNYRLDTLIVWEDRCLTANERPDTDATLIALPAVELVSADPPDATDLATLVDDTPAELPRRRQSRRRRAS